MSVQKRKETGKWYVRYRDEYGKQRNKTFGKGKIAKKRAEAYDLEIKTKKLRREQLVMTKSQGHIYYDELKGLWVKEKKREGCGKWLDDFVTVSNNHLLEALSQVPVAKLTKDFLVDYVHEHWKHAKPTTRARYLSYLKVIFNWGIAQGYLKENPLAAWKKPKEQPKQTVLTLEELKKIRAAAVPHIQWVIDIALALGVRTGLSELLVLKWKDVNFTNHSVLVFATKTQTFRTIPITREFYEKLKQKKAVAKTKYLVEYHGRNITTIKKGFRSACRRAGISDEIISYDIRHLVCSTMLSKGADPVSTAKIMGHASTKMTLDRYGHVLPGELERAVNLLPSL